MGLEKAPKSVSQMMAREGAAGAVRAATRLRDVVEAERPDQATAADVGDGEREQRALR